MQLVVEFFGLPRRLSGAKQTTVHVSPGATLHNVVAELAAQFPAFVGPLIDPMNQTLKEPYFFNIDARRVPKSLDYQPKEGEKLLLLFLEAGG